MDFVLNYIIVLISITSLFILVTMIHDWDKVFYLKYRLYYKSYEKQSHKLEDNKT